MFNLSRVPPTVGDMSQKGNDYSQTRTLRPENGITDTNQNEWGVIAGHGSREKFRDCVNGLTVRIVVVETLKRSSFNARAMT